MVPADPRVSVAVETLRWPLPLAAGYLIVLQVLGQGHFTDYGAGHVGAADAGGPCHGGAAAAVRRRGAAAADGHDGPAVLPDPGLQMAWGVLVGHEPMPPARWIGFALIWVALAVFTVDALRQEVDGSIAAVSIWPHPDRHHGDKLDRLGHRTRRTTSCVTAC